MKYPLSLCVLAFCVSCSHGMKWAFDVSKGKNRFSLVKGSPSPAIYPLWTVRAGISSNLRLRLFHNTSPALFGELVIQGNGWDGIQAFKRKNGKQVWSYEIKGGVSSPLMIHAGVIYFGSADGFVYAVTAKTGRRLWKFFTGSENTGAPVVRKGKVYFISAGQKIYALSAETGKLLWLYSGPALSGDFFIRGAYRPEISGNTLYGGFYEGTVVALNRKTGQLKWRVRPVSSPLKAPARGLFLQDRCLLAPLFGEGLFCLNPQTGKTRWKSVGGGTRPVIKGTTLYQGNESGVYSLRRFDGKVNWSVKAKNPLTPALYKNILLYGLSSKGRLYAVSSQTGKAIFSFPFGRGLASPLTVDQKSGEAYFFSVDGYLHKIRLMF